MNIHFTQAQWAAMLYRDEIEHGPIKGQCYKARDGQSVFVCEEEEPRPKWEAFGATVNDR